MYINFRTKKTDTSVIWDGMVNTATGEITARSVSRRYEHRLNVRTKVNKSPCTDEDFIVLSAREKLKEVTK